MNIPRQEALLLVGLIFIAGLVFTLMRLWRARTHGVSLRMQVFFALGALSVLLTATFATIIVDRFAARTEVFAHRAALDDARVVAELTARAMDTLGVTLLQGSRMMEASRVLYGFTTTLQDTRVQILSDAGRVLFDSLETPIDKDAFVSRPEVQSALSGKIDEIARLLDDKTVAAAAPIVVKGRVFGVARVVKSTFSMRQVLADTAPKVALLALILAVATALAGILIGHSVAVPIERLTSAAQKIAQGQRQAVLPSPRGREVRNLTAAFESMRSELEQRHAMESFAADLSHELKNPVASIRAASEVLQDALINDVEAAGKFALRISESAEKLEVLLKDLLALARLEARGIAETKKELDLADTVRAAIDDIGFFASQTNVRIEFVSDGRPLLLGDARWLKRAVDNLLLNAIAFAPADSVVSVQLSARGDDVELLVSDRGSGIDKSLQEKVFERFSTSRKEQGGTGLGLAIVRAVAEAHGGHAEVRKTSASGTSIAMTFNRT